MTVILLCSDPDKLREALKQYPRTGTVEAEYGDVCVEGNVRTLAHHGSRQYQPVPCSEDNWEKDQFDAIGLSHIDLDAVGGVAALLGIKPDVPDFWDLVAYFDTNGLHRILETFQHCSQNREQEYQRLFAWLAWKADYCPAVKAPEVVDVTAQVLNCITAIKGILEDDDATQHASDKFLKRQKALNHESYSLVMGEVIARISAESVNHLYMTPDGKKCSGIVAFNTASRAITISTSDRYAGVSCVQVVRDLWGLTAGGHETIAGSPRDREMTTADLVQAQRVLARAFSQQEAKKLETSIINASNAVFAIEEQLPMESSFRLEFYRIRIQLGDLQNKARRRQEV